MEKQSDEEINFAKLGAKKVGTIKIGHKKLAVDFDEQMRKLGAKKVGSLLPDEDSDSQHTEN